MTLKKLTLAILFSIAFTFPLQAALINDMQTCQGFLDFLDSKLDEAPSKYSSKDVNTVRVGLKEYNEYIQEEIVTPGLIKFNNGDTSKAKSMQKQVDQYKLNLVKAYKKRYPKNRLYMDYAISINECAKKAVPKGDSLEKLKAALNAVVKLAKIE